MSTGARGVAATAAWLVTLAVIYMVFTGEWTAVDWVGAGGCALVAAAVTVPMMRMRLFDLRFRLRWLAQVPSSLARVIPDFYVITVFLARGLIHRERGGGRFVARRDFPAGAADAEGTAWRGFVAVTSTVSPNSYVVDIDPATQRRLSHDLVPSRASERPA